MAATAVILDLDGTVWNSYPLFAAVLERERDVPAAKTIAALEQRENIVHLMDAVGVSRQRFGAVAAELVTTETLYDGIAAALDQLSDRDVPLGIFTSLPRAIAGPILDALALPDYFVDIVYAVGPLRKPNPEGINRILRAAGVRPSATAFYVGDQPHDSEAAENASVSFAWAMYGYGDDEPTFVTTRIAHPRELAQL